MLWNPALALKLFGFKQFLILMDVRPHRHLYQSPSQPRFDPGVGLAVLSLFDLRSEGRRLADPSEMIVVTVDSHLAARLER